METIRKVDSEAPLVPVVMVASVGMAAAIRITRPLADLVLVAPGATVEAGALVAAASAPASVALGLVVVGPVVVVVALAVEAAEEVDALPAAVMVVAVAADRPARRESPTPLPTMQVPSELRAVQGG